MIGQSACKGRVLNRSQYQMQQNIGGPFTGPVQRHLMYYVWPRTCWREQIQQMLQRIDLFNGQRLLVIAYDEPHDIALVENSYGTHWSHILPCHNIKELREVVGWLPCLQRLVSNDPNSVIFTAHAKGVTHPDNPVIQRWAREMYTINLDYWPAIEAALQRSAMAGAFRRIGQFPKIAHMSSDKNCLTRWHYSGTFYWMRAKDLACRNWRHMDWTWYGTESYPGVQFSFEQCECLVGDLCDDLYQASTWEKLEPAITAWKESQKRSFAQ